MIKDIRNALEEIGRNSWMTIEDIEKDFPMEEILDDEDYLRYERDEDIDWENEDVFYCITFDDYGNIHEFRGSQLVEFGVYGADLWAGLSAMEKAAYVAGYIKGKKGYGEALSFMPKDD